MSELALFETEPRMERDALVSEDGLYRYTLSRRWAPGPLLPFGMLNPSTASKDVDDPSDPTWLITCPWCKHEETALWWAQRINPTARKIHLANAAGVAAHLSLKYVIDLKVRKKAIDELTIRNWAWRQLSGQHRADCVDKDGTRPNLDCRGCRPAFDAVACSLKSRRLLYDVDEVESHARKVYGFADLDLEEAS